MASCSLTGNLILRHLLRDESDLSHHCERVTVLPVSPSQSGPQSSTSLFELYPRFAATESVTVPFPVPPLPPAIVTNEALLTAVHVQKLASGLTVTLAVPPVAATLMVVVESVKKRSF